MGPFEDAVPRKSVSPHSFIIPPILNIHLSPEADTIEAAMLMDLVSLHSCSCFTFSHQNITEMIYKQILQSLDFPIQYIPGATPKKPFSGLMALSCPLLSNFIHAMSSPTHSTLYPGNDGHIMARFVLPHALGNAAAIYFLCPAGFVMPRIYEDKSDEHMVQQTPKKQII
jgi:hypothetical protein